VEEVVPTHNAKVAVKNGKAERDSCWVMEKKGVPSPYRHKIAVMLNLNARKVVERHIEIAGEVVGAENVFATRSLEEADLAMERILSRGYGVVVPAGGDGTLFQTIQRMVERINENEKLRLPRFAFVPLGTGNAMNRLVGPGFWHRKDKLIRLTLEKLKSIVDQAAKYEEDMLPVIQCPVIRISTEKDHECNGELCFFAGAGFDSAMLDDYNGLKRWCADKPYFVRKCLRSVAGYVITLFIKTLPKSLWNNRSLRVRITAPRRGPPTYWMDPRRADAAIPLRPPGTCVTDQPCHVDTTTVFQEDVDTDHRILVYEGHAAIVAAGTAPYYGGGMKLFPFARIHPHNVMHLRVSRLGPFRTLPHLYGIFRGTYRSYNLDCLDFIGKEFEIELNDPYPFQHSGEAFHKKLNKFKFVVADEEIEFIDFLDPRPIVAY